MIPTARSACAPRVARRAAEAAARARAVGHPLYLAVSVARPAFEPLAFAAGLPADAPRALLVRPASGPDAARAEGTAGPEALDLVAGGAVAEIETSGRERFALARARAEALFDAVLADPEAPEAAAPRLLGGFAFTDAGPAWPGFPAGRLVLPERLLVRALGETWLTAVARVDPGAAADDVAARLEAALAVVPGRVDGTLPRVCVLPTDDREGWHGRVAEAKEAIAAGRLRKVVLARQVRLRAAMAIPALPLVTVLARDLPGCLAFAFAPTQAAAFVGATPERLVRRRGPHVVTGALAGSAARGATPEDDRNASAGLCASAKDRSEHELVVEAIRRALEPLADLPRASTPRVVRLPNVQHLFTPIDAELAGPVHILDLVGRLHPTPAIAGSPRAAALDFLRVRESLDRGWYGGAIGWVDRAGDGDFAVAIRAARLAGNEARLFAGAGIVAGSDADAEWAETGMKLRAIGTALGVM